MAGKVGGLTSGRASWIARLRDQRPHDAKQVGGERDRDQMDAPGRARGLDQPAIELLGAAGVPEKLIDEHGASLAGALGDIAGLVKLGDAMEPWRKKQLDRALGQIFKVLGLQLARAPEDARAEVATRTIAALRHLAEGNGANDLLMPSLFAVSGLIDSGVRLDAQKKLVLAREEAAGVAEAASRAVQDLKVSLEGRSGVGSAINVYANIAEQVERASGALTQKKRAELWKASAKLIAGATPMRGFDQAAAASLAERVSKAIAQGQDGKQALETAKQAGAEELRPLAEQAMRQLRAEPANIPAGTPQRQCLDHVTAALEKVLRANPQGPQVLFQAVEALRARAEQVLVNPWNQDVFQIWGCGAALIDRVSKQPIALETLNHLATLLPQLSGRNMSVAALQRAVDAADLHSSAIELVNTQIGIWNRTLAHYPGLEPALERLRQLPEAAAMQVVIALSPQMANAQQATALAGGLIDMVVATRGDDMIAHLSAFSARFAMLYGRISAWLGHNDKIAAIAAKIARSTAGAIAQPQADQIGQMLRSLQWTMQRIELDQVVTRDEAGRPGIADINDPAIRYRYPPATFFESIINQMRPHVQHDPAKQLEYTRLAIELSAKLGNIDGDWQTPFHQRVLPDLNQAIANRARLNHAARAQGGVAVRAQQQQTIAAFLEAHPELPLELAFSAGVHLDREQLAWVVERIGLAKGRDTVRSLRDFLFGCITANRKDMIDVVRLSNSPAKAISNVITEVGREFRANRWNAVAWNDIAAGLKAGGDPMAAMQKQNVAAGLEGLNVEQLAGGKVDPLGAETIARCAPAITSCIKYYNEQRGQANTDAQIDYAPVLGAFMEVLKSVASGTWPSVKYENEVGRRLLAILTPEQEEIWRTEIVTPLGGGDVLAGDQALRSVVQLLKGLVKALPQEVALPAGLAWDRATLDKLGAERAKLLEELHGVEKGSAKHRELGNKLGVLNRSASAIELQVALASKFEGKKVDHRSLLLELRPLLENAASGLRALGARGSYQAVNEAIFVARDLRSSPRQGRYAVDEDSLEAAIMSHTAASGSCLNYVNGFRRWGLAGSAADANIRMLRSYDGDKFGYRAFLKLFPVEFAGYKGPGLWIDTPMREGNGQPEDLQLLYKTAIRKARGMGIPVMGTDQNLLNAGKEQGLETKAGQVTFSVDEGNTGAQHSDFLFGGAGNVRRSRGQNQYWSVARNVQIVMPPAKPA